ncbi:uncharacterized protein LOC133300869 [Gastrolobium bilobum]|uniref:uncharacterized protein LOC133300869 n=1 Tax=Gastrolobium bilobum TaxID=150636 RepID=UPI002AB23B2E|nr:uncharacterized protein LOC133300869 [Gastrolobium bilobum]
MATPNPPPEDKLMESILASLFTRPNSSIVGPPIVANNYAIHPSLISLVEKTLFGGEDYEDPHDFMDRFIRICDTTKHHGISDEAIRLRLFPFAVTRKTHRWLDRQAPNSIRTWDELSAKFFAEHVSMEKYNKLVNEITNFTQQPGETLCAAWTRFQELIRKCPQYDLPDGKKVRVFYNGMTPDSRMVFNGAAAGTIRKKTTTQTLELIDYMTKNENASMAVQPRKGLLQLGNNDVVLAEHKVISQQLASMNAKLDKMQVSTAQNFQRNKNNAPGNNFQRGVQGGGLDFKSNNYLQPPPIPHKEPFGLEKVMLQLSKTTNDHIQTTDTFINETRAYHKNQDAFIRNLENQIGQLSRQLVERNQGQFQSNTIVNPREDCKSIVTRSGIVITPQEKPKVVQKKKADEPVIELEQKREEETSASEKEEPAKKEKGEAKEKAVETPKKQ